jgi:hypothetical protein
MPVVRNVAEISEELFQRDIIVEEIIWFAANCASQSDAFERFVEEDPEEFVRITGIDPGKLGSNADEVSSELARKRVLGFAVRASTPVPNYYAGGCYASSFGHTRGRWFYTEKFSAEFANELIAWRESIHETAKAEAK